MDRDAKLKEFAAALFSHVYREYNTTFDLPVKLPHVFSTHAPQDCSKEEAAAVLRLCLALRGVFNGLFVKCFETFQRSTQHFMTFLTSRCLKLCAGGDDDVFLSFCMVCAFVAELNLFCLINGCFAFMSTAPKCLQAIFNRRLRKEFYASGGWESLKFFAEHFARDVPPEDVVSEGLLASIKDKLDEDSSEDDSSSTSNSDEDDEDIDEDDEAKDGEKSAEIAPPLITPGIVIPIPGAPSTAAHSDSGDDSSDSESEMDSDDSDSDEESEEELMPLSRRNGLKRPREESSDSEEEESEGEVKKPNGLKPSVDDSDDDSDSEDESETSSMSDEETEDSESDAAPTVQTNCIKPITHENLNVDKKVL